jgi:hypothetical protein
MKTKIVGLVLAVAMLLTPVAFMAPVRAQEVPPEGAKLVVELSFTDVITGGGYGPDVYAFQYKIGGGGKTWLSEPYELGEDGKPAADGTITIDDTTYYLKKGDLTLYSDAERTQKAGELTTVGYYVRTEDEVYATVTLSTTGEPVNNATVSWVGDPQTTDAFGETGAFVAPFRESPKNYGTVRAAKEYGTNTTVKRSVFGESKYPIIVWPYDLSEASEFLAWWGHFALTAEAQAMYEAAEILGEWGANLGTEGVTVWSNIFGPKGGSLAKFIKGFPQFMVDRGAAIEATKNMLDTIWALFTLLPAFVLASPQLLQTLPMRMLQFWPVLFINLDKVLNGISDMVIDLGVFMTSLAPSILLLLPEIFERLPEIGPNAMNIVLTSFELFVQVIPALSQYLPAAIAAIPAFYIQMLMALFFNAPAIISTAMGESFDTITKLFRSWPLFPAGIAAGILAVAPALMMLPSLAPLVLLGRTLENTVGALSSWMESLREAPSELLDPILHALGTNPATLGARYLIVLGYCLGTSFLFAPAILITMFVLGIAMTPLILLMLALLLAPVFALLMFVPVVGWCWDIIWACWMAVSTIAAFAVTLPSTCGDILDYTANRIFQICTIPGYACGWFLQGILDVLSINILSRLQDLIGKLAAELPQIIAYIQPRIEALMGAAGAGAQGIATTGGGSLFDIIGSMGSFAAGMAAGAAGGATVGAAGGAAATGAAALAVPVI